MKKTRSLTRQKLHDDSAIDNRLDDLSPVREFPRIDKFMDLRKGMSILAHRLGLSGPKISKMLDDRYPAKYVFGYMGLSKFHVRCFLRFDIIFSDILHVGHDELRYLGIGRKFLVSRMLRIVLAGMCDAYDASGNAGDFPPYSWLQEEQAERIRDIQHKCLMLMKKEQSKLLLSVKMRLMAVSTQVLKALLTQDGVIRNEVRKAERLKSGAGLRRFSSWLHNVQKEFIQEGKSSFKKHLAQCRKRRKKYCRRIWDVTTRKDVFRSCMSDLKNRIDPSTVCWYRRPTDEDWLEGQRADRRKPPVFDRKHTFNKLKMSGVPGMTEPVSAEHWNDIRADLKLKYVKNRYLLERRKLRIQRLKETGLTEDIVPVGELP